MSRRAIIPSEPEAFDAIAFFGAVGLVAGLVLGIVAALAWGLS